MLLLLDNKFYYCFTRYTLVYYRVIAVLFLTFSIFICDYVI